jgi:hypothetical protein
MNRKLAGEADIGFHGPKMQLIQGSDKIEANKVSYHIHSNVH